MNILVNIHSLDKNLVYISNEMILFDFSYIYCCKITMQQYFSIKQRQLLHVRLQIIRPSFELFNEVSSTYGLLR